MKKVFSIIILLAVISGCKKNGDVQKTPVPEQKLLLSSQLSLNAYGVTILNYKYWYDENNNLIQTLSPEFQLGDDTLKYAYDTNGNLIKTNALGSVGYTYINNMPNTEYNLNDPGSVTDKYVVTNNKVTSIIDNSSGLARYNITYSGNNFKSVFYGLGLDTNYVTTFTYGTKKSPFYYTGFKWFLGAGTLYDLQSQNEIIGEVVTTKQFESPPAVDIYTYKYEYNDAGYPVKCTSYKNGTITGYQYYTYTPIK